MDDLKTSEEIKEVELTDEEEKAYRDGLALEEMVLSNPGWQIVKKWLEDRAFHTWADPRETDSEEKWAWRELNAFYAASNARELLEAIDKAVSDARYLDKVKKGEIQKKGFKI